MEIYGWSLIISLLFLLVGYATGRRQGINLGRNIGKAEAGILLREESLRSGRCKTCNRIYN